MDVGGYFFMLIVVTRIFVEVFKVFDLVFFYLFSGGVFDSLGLVSFFIRWI